MRVVTNAHLQRLQDAIEAVGKVAQQASHALSIAQSEFASAMLDGNPNRAAETEARAYGKNQFLASDAGARLEIAAVGFLGLRRWPCETLVDYYLRIQAAAVDLSTVLATQREHGIVYRP